ncbi:restriction endonuclease subunit S [Priestia megaterium]|uniref:restriction endonuclease subunit S n=1 Tax=Priestia megaterium TaxID=1404 RepID=UPI0028777CC1|nr:restriction endonuclease subunit S [Priestia megaterium]MBX4163362.1 restriction endonuclease subunit S [Priestia megaterium]
MTSYKDFLVGDLFEIRPTKSYGLTNNTLLKSKGNTPVISNSSSNNGVLAYVGFSPTEKKGIITFSDTGTYATESIFYQPKDFIGYSHVQGMYPKFNPLYLTKNVGIYIATTLRKSVSGMYDYSRKFNRENVSKTIINLPITEDGTPDWNTMDEYVKYIEKQYVNHIDRYLQSLGYISIEDTCLLNNDKAILKEHSSANLEIFKLEELFDVIKRGKRIKSFDRIKGNLPFITAGIEKMGFSDYIGNPEAEVFPANSLTIDMFGNTFYRGYEYGADDHVAILYRTDEKFSRAVLQYIQPHINKAIKGKFSYSRNFYASDAPEIEIKLPVTLKGEIDYDLIENYISVIQKKVVKQLRAKVDKEVKLFKNVVS